MNYWQTFEICRAGCGKTLSMNTIETRLLERLKKLPPGRVAEVVDFVDFLAAREERAVAAKRLGDTFTKIDELGLPPLSEDEIESEVQSDRRSRRQGT